MRISDIFGVLLFHTELYFNPLFSNVSHTYSCNLGDRILQIRNVWKKGFWKESKTLFTYFRFTKTLLISNLISPVFESSTSPEKQLLNNQVMMKLNLNNHIWKKLKSNTSHYIGYFVKIKRKYYGSFYLFIQPSPLLWRVFLLELLKMIQRKH